MVHFGPIVKNFSDNKIIVYQKFFGNNFGSDIVKDFEYDTGQVYTPPRKEVKLKHYMVASNANFSYIFPIKYYYEPLKNNKVWHADSDSTKLEPRRLQPDQFGGTAETTKLFKSGPKGYQQTLRENYNLTIKKEYREESGYILPQYNFLFSQKYADSWGVGAISLLIFYPPTPNVFSTYQNISVQNPDRGYVETAGVVCIDCSDLRAQRQNKKPEEIKDSVIKKLIEERDLFIAYQNGYLNRQIKTPALSDLLSSNKKIVPTSSILPPGTEVPEKIYEVLTTSPFNEPIKNWEIPNAILELITYDILYR